MTNKYPSPFIREKLEIDELLSLYLTEDKEILKQLGPDLTIISYEMLLAIKNIADIPISSEVNKTDR